MPTVAETTRYVARNLIIGYGVYMISWWVAYPIARAYDRLTDRLIYRGDFGGYVVMPIVATVPYAVVAAGVGACVAWMADSRPLQWALCPAALYVYFGLVGHHWAQPPTFLDRVAQLLDAGFMGIACIAGAMIVANVGQKQTK